MPLQRQIILKLYKNLYIDMKFLKKKKKNPMFLLSNLHGDIADAFFVRDKT